MDNHLTDPTVVEFNSDDFFCNKLKLETRPDSCSQYHLTTDCTTIKPVYDHQYSEKKSGLMCELCKNYKYSDLYKTYQTTSSNYNDYLNRYNNAWIQRWNLGIGISLLLYILYRQQ